MRTGTPPALTMSEAVLAQSMSGTIQTMTLATLKETTWQGADYLTVVTTDAHGTLAEAPEESAARVPATAGTSEDMDGKVEGLVYDVP